VEDDAVNINLGVTFVKPFVFTGIQRVKTGLAYKRTVTVQESWTGCLFMMPWSTVSCRDSTIWSL